MNIKMLTTGSVLIAIILLLAINIFSNTALTSARMDLTENDLFTLSTGTKNILKNLDEPVNVRLFLSQKLATRLPGISSYATRVKELLQEYSRTADGNINLTIIDPEPFSETEDQAVGYGLRGAPIDSETTFYFGLVVTGATDEEETIPFFSPEREEFTEYDITKIIQQVANPTKKVVGLISSISIDGSPAPHIPGMGMMPRPTETWTVVAQMRQFFEVRSLDMDIDKIPDDVDVLMLVHPKELSEATLYAIDQYILNGGRLLAFVDPHAETDQVSSQQSGMPGTNFGASNLNKLFQPWGISTAENKVVGDIQLAQKVTFNLGQRTAAVDYPIWMKIPKDRMNASDIITSELGTLNFASPGKISITQTANVTVTPLINTTDKSTEVDKASLSFMADPQELLRNYRPSGEAMVLAARVTGKVKSAFPDGAPKSGGDNKPQEPAKFTGQLTESKVDINVIVVADTDLLEDRFWVRIQDMFGSRIAVPIAANGSFVINALDNLMGSNDLISVRNRGHFSRPFTRVNKIRQEAELHYREKEQQLMNRLRETERKLVELQRGKEDDKALILSNEQQVELERFQQERIKIRKELRQVRHQLQQNIDRLEAWMKFINIGLIPILIGIGGGLFAIMKLKRRETPTRVPATIT
ncbi:MAG TPA: Gldg family protein [Gammaproteobacteria bacterium]